MTPKPKHFFVFRFPRLTTPPEESYNSHTGELVTTLAVSPEQAANNAIYSTFYPLIGDRFKNITRYLHETHPNLSNLAVDIDELDKPTIQPKLFGGQKASHKRRDPNRLTRKIAERFNISTEGENSQARTVATEYIKHKRKHPIDQQPY